MGSFDSFFADPNRIRPDGANAASRLAERSCADPSGLVVLPWSTSEADTRWYVLALDESLEQVREEVLAHVGVSYTDYRGQPTPLDPADPGDSAVATVADGRACIRVDLLTVGMDFAVSESLGRLMALWGSRPVSKFRPTRGLAEALHDYRMSVRTAQRDGADEALDDLRRLGLDIVNVRFMELELLSRFDGPAAVLAHPQVNELLLINRPASVTDLLAQAVDRVHLRPAPGIDTESVKANFAQLPDHHRRLLTSPGQIRSQSGLLLLALSYTERGHDPSSLRAGIVADIAIDDDTERILGDLCVEFEEAPPPETTTSDIASRLRELLDQGRDDEALELAENADPVYEVVWSALYAARRLDSLAAAQRALAVLEGAATEVRNQVPTDASPLLTALQGLVRGSAPQPLVGDWNDYFENLAANPDWTTALEVAERGVSEWPLVPFINDAACVLRLCRYVEAHDQGTTFVRTIPFLVEWLSRVPEQDRSAVIPVEQSLIAYLCLYDTTTNGLKMVGQLAEGLISFGLDAVQFEQLVDHLEYRWEGGSNWSGSKAPETVGWATDLIEAMTDNACGDPARGATFTQGLFRSMNAFFSRLDVPVKRHVVLLATELDLERLLPREQDVEEVETRDCRGTKVCHYSLCEKTLQRAKDSLEQRWRNLDVVSRSDMRGSNELGGHARNAALMVVGFRAAQHSAPDCISDHRPPNKPTRKVSGKSSLEFVLVTEAWLMENL